MSRKNKNNANMRKEDAQAAVIEKAAIAAQAKTDAESEANAVLDEEQNFAHNKDQLNRIDIRNSDNINLNAVRANSSVTSQYRQIDNSANLRTAGTLLRYHRQRAQITLNDIAAQVKVRATTIADIENDRVCDQKCSVYISDVIRKYAIALQIDPQAVVDLYMQNVDNNVRISKERTDRNQYQRYSARNWVLLVLIILVASAGYFVFSGKQQNKEEASLSGSLNDNAQQNVNAVRTDEPLVSGVLDQSDDVAKSAETSESVVIEDEANKNAPQVQVVDENTVKATAQAQALQEDAANNVENAQQEVNHQSLELPNSSNLTFDESAAPQIHTNSLIDVNDSIAEQKVEQEAKQEQELTKQKAEQEAKQEQELAKQKTEQEENKATNIKLNKSLKDISSQISVVDREGLASLNSVEINFTDDAVIKVLDGTDKVKAEGFYEKGQQLKLSGIPPFKISITNTAAIKIAYMGGKVRMPKSKQVKFELPMR